MYPLTRLPPDSRAKAAGHRLHMAAALAQLARHDDEPSRGIARALRTTALGWIPAEERVWSRRIDARRLEVAELADELEPDEVGVWDLRGAVQWMSTPPVLGRLLMRLVRELRPDSCLELGTGFGISGAYQAAALALNGSGRLLTVDTDPRPAAIARHGFASLGLARSVTVEAGETRGTTARVLEQASPIDFAFVDADHREAATMQALELLLPALRSGAVLVFDDIASSWAGMRDAWRKMIAAEEVELAFRLARFGVIVVRHPARVTMPALDVQKSHQRS